LALAATGIGNAVSDGQPSFTRGVFAGSVHDELLFPFPESLDRKNPEEAAVVRRLIGEVDRMERTRIIDPAKFDEDETVSEEVIAEFGRTGLLAMTIPKQYGGLELSHTAYARVFERISAIDPSAFLGLAASGLALTATPAAAFETAAPSNHAVSGVEAFNHSDGRDRYRSGNRDRDRYNGRYAARYDEPVYRDSRVWRGRDGRTYCRKKDGTTGLIIGAAAGALLGREVDTRGERTTGTILGAAAGALLGKKVAGGTSCR
jgi:hypothetical protein